MKTKSVNTYLVRPRWGFVEICTDDGLCGWGEAVLEGHAATVQACVEEMSEYLIGADPRRIEDIWTTLYRAGFYRGGGVLMSAIAGIDQELYEAGAVDGLGRWGMVKHITLPSILPTIVLLFILGIGGILNIGYEQNLLIGQPTTREYWDIIDTYVYRYGIQMGRHSFAIAVGLMKSIIGLILVFTTNFIAKKTMDMSIF